MRINCKFLLLCSLVFLVLFAGCKSDEDKCKDGDVEACGRIVRDGLANALKDGFKDGHKKSAKDELIEEIKDGLKEELGLKEDLTEQLDDKNEKDADYGLGIPYSQFEREIENAKRGFPKKSKVKSVKKESNVDLKKSDEDLEESDVELKVDFTKPLEASAYAFLSNRMLNRSDLSDYSKKGIENFAKRNFCNAWAYY